MTQKALTNIEKLLARVVNRRITAIKETPEYEAEQERLKADALVEVFGETLGARIQGVIDLDKAVNEQIKQLQRQLEGEWRNLQNAFIDYEDAEEGFMEEMSKLSNWSRTGSYNSNKASTQLFKSLSERYAKNGIKESPLYTPIQRYEDFIVRIDAAVAMASSNTVMKKLIKAVYTELGNDEDADLIEILTEVFPSFFDEE
jgi:hypothetical protein